MEIQSHFTDLTIRMVEKTFQSEITNVLTFDAQSLRVKKFS